MVPPGKIWKPFPLWELGGWDLSPSPSKGRCPPLQDLDPLERMDGTALTPGPLVWDQGTQGFLERKKNKKREKLLGLGPINSECHKFYNKIKSPIKIGRLPTNSNMVGKKSLVFHALTKYGFSYFQKLPGQP